jgi:hypothetical protein
MYLHFLMVKETDTIFRQFVKKKPPLLQSGLVLKYIQDKLEYIMEITFLTNL